MQQQSALLALPFVALLLLAARADDEPAPKLEVTYLANEGFLLSVGETDVLIDAFVGKPYAGYAGLDPGDLDDMLAARGPFESIELALVSHAHGDHYQPQTARAFLEQSPDTALVSSPRVIDTLELDEEQAGERVRALLPDTGQTASFEHAGVHVDLWRLRHSGREDDGLQNLGHWIQIGDFTVLHLGDAAMDAELFAPYATKDVLPDLALVPYWYWQAPPGRALLEGPLRAVKTIAVHIPPREITQVVEGLGLDFPGVGVPERARQQWSLEAAPH